MYRLCKHCGIVEHEMDKNTSISFQGDYYCSLACFNKIINLDNIQRLEQEIVSLQGTTEELKNEIDDLSYMSCRASGLEDNLVYIHSKLLEVYGLDTQKENYKDLYKQMEEAVSYLMEYYNDDVNVDI